jgi:hypothetical protein
MFRIYMDLRNGKDLLGYCFFTPFLIYTLEDLKPHPPNYFLYFSQNNIDD